jgi:hypothetical protein
MATEQAKYHSAAKLSVKQELFCREFVANKGNATRAAMNVYDTEDPVTAAAIGYENLRKPQIASRITQILSENVQSLAPEDVAREISELAFNKTLRPTERMKLLELLGKWSKLGMWVNISESRSVPRKVAREHLKDVSTEELTQALLDRLEMHRRGELPGAVNEKVT